MTQWQTRDLSHFRRGEGGDIFDVHGHFSTWLEHARPGGYYLDYLAANSAPGTDIEINGFRAAIGAFFHAHADALVPRLPAPLRPVETHLGLAVPALTIFDFDQSEVGPDLELVASIVVAPPSPGQLHRVEIDSRTTFPIARGRARRARARQQPDRGLARRPHR